MYAKKLALRLKIYGTMFVALVLNLMAFPSVFEHLKPNFLVLIVLFWVVSKPNIVNVGHAFFCGLVLDLSICTTVGPSDLVSPELASGSTLGIRALAFSLMAYLIGSTFVKFENYSYLQQSISVGIVSFIGQIMIFWLEHAFGFAIVDFHFLLSVLSDAVLWPIVFTGLKALLRVRQEPTSNEI